MFRRLEENRYDYTLLALVILLVCIGLVMVYSASHYVAMKKFHDDGAFYFKKHFIRVFIGFVFMIIGALVPYKFWFRISKLILLISIGLLILVPFVGVTISNATRWIDIGGFRFQPVDFVRLGLIIYLSEAMVRKRDYLDHFKEGFFPQLLVVGIISVLLLQQPDMGSALMLIMIALVIFVTAGVNFRHIGATMFLPVFGVLLVKEYQLLRIKSYLDSVLHGLPVSYQVKQSMISLGHGGFLGVGLDNSVQKLQYLPEPYTDFIFAIIGEEFGFLGTTAVLTLFLVLIYRGYKIARRCPDDGGALLATGITTSIGLYAFINAGVVCNLLPTKGLPMPFISYGGTFMISTLAAIGILLNISQHREVDPSRAGRRIGRSEEWEEL